MERSGLEEAGEPRRWVGVEEDRLHQRRWSGLKGRFGRVVDGAVLGRLRKVWREEMSRCQERGSRAGRQRRGRGERFRGRSAGAAAAAAVGVWWQSLRRGKGSSTGENCSFLPVGVKRLYLVF
jgi:hypothetical protein